MTGVAYYELPDLGQVYLEDSFVMGVTVVPGTVEVRLDLVLREHHPDYVDPRQDEQYCFRRGVLRFDGVEEVMWRMPRTRPAIDASGDTDYGGVDSYKIDGTVHLLVGEIGELTITCQQHSLHLDPES